MSAVKVCGSTIELPLKLVTSRRVEDGGTSEVAVKCLDITWNPDSEGSCPDSI